MYDDWILHKNMDKNMDNKPSQQVDCIKNSVVSISETAHKINNMNHAIMLNTPIVKAAWNEVVSMLKEYSGELEDYTVAGMPFEQACSIIPQLIEGIERSSSHIKNIVVDLKQFSAAKTRD